MFGRTTTACNLCGAKVDFVSIREGLGGQLSAAGYPHPIDSFETLNPDGYGCPECGSADRDRLYRLFLDRWFAGRSGPVRVLDFAPAPALQGYLKAQPGVVYRSADLFMDGVDDQVDITDMALYGDDSFDLFVCSHVLEHVSDDGRALRELRRVLAPGGAGIVMTPVAPPGSYDEDVTVEDVDERWRRFAQDDHVRLYDRETLVGRIRAAGFTVREWTEQDFGKKVFRRNGITAKSRLYTVS